MTHSLTWEPAQEIDDGPPTLSIEAIKLEVANGPYRCRRCGETFASTMRSLERPCRSVESNP